MRNSNNIHRYIREVRENFSGFQGGYANQKRIGGVPRYGFTGGNELQYSATGAVMPPGGAPVQMNPAPSVSAAASLPIIVNVSNTTAGSLTAILFGSALNQNLTNFGNPTGIAVTSGNTNISYGQVLAMIISTTFGCSNIRLIDSSSTAQVQQSWTVSSVNLEGQLVSTPIPNTASFSPFQNRPEILDLNYPLKLDGLTQVSFVMLPTPNTMTCYFYPASLVSSVNTLVTGNPIAQYATPNLPSVFSTSPVAAIPMAMQGNNLYPGSLQ